MSMAYWELPEDILESRDDLSVWVEKAVQASVWDKTKKPKKK
jgi:TfoX/Sxy family transcriptional regulator of competence genes